MLLIEFYPELKQAHVSLVGASGALFALRGAAVLAGAAWAMRRPWRLLSYVIDTLLLCAGVTLWTLLHLDPVQSSWLGVKLALLVLYILLGSLALKRGRTPAVRRASFAAALVTFLFMVTVAVKHHPLGLLAP